MAPALTIVPICSSTLPPGSSQRRPLCWNVGHASLATKMTMRTMTSSTAARQRAERELGALVRPRLSQPLEHYFSGTQCLPTIAWALALFCTQEMKAETTPVARPRVTIQKLRTPPYSPDLALRRLQATPL